MSGLRLAWHQFRFDLRTFTRDPAKVYFTLGLPLVFFVIFSAIFGDNTVPARGGVKVSTYYVPAIGALAVISATFVNLAISLTQSRERGVLKRLRGTPLPAAAYVAGRVGTCLALSLAMIVLLLGLGALLYDAPVPGAGLVELGLALVVGTACFCCLGFAMTALIPTEGAAPAVTNAIGLPLYFISGLFIPDDELPAGVLHVADLFPYRHLFQAFFAAFDPRASGPNIQLGHLAVLALWGAFGLLVALRTFRWAPRT